MYNAEIVADRIIRYSEKIGVPVNAKRLQLLLYFTQAEFMVSEGKPCFSESIVAGRYGPVIPAIEDAFGMYGEEDIPAETTKTKGNMVSVSDAAIIDDMVNTCSRYSVKGLAIFARNQRPWKQAYEKGTGTEIVPLALWEFFEEDKENPKYRQKFE